MKHFFSLLPLSLIFFIFSVNGQVKTDTQDIKAYWYLQKNDTLLGVNYHQLNHHIKSKKIQPKETVIAAVIDAGFDFLHPDLKELAWKNNDEKINNNKDDDCNGYVDDINGWNFLGNSSGENIEKVGTAAFRSYKQLRKKYANADTTLLTPIQKEEFSLYKKMEKEAKLDSYIKFEKYLSELNDMYNISDSLMTACYGEKETTLKDFYKIEVKDTTGVVEPLKIIASSVAMFPKDKLWKDIIEINRSKYELAHKRVKSLDDYSNDPHIKIGNNPDDFQDYRYGNNHIDIDPYHGTMVAGLVGLGKTQAYADIKIMGIRSIPDGDEYDKDIVAAIRYAVDNGAKIINMSFGKKVSRYSKEVETAIKYAAKNDVLIVKASGNDGLNTDLTPNYPKGTDTEGNVYDNMIIVGSSLKDGTLASFSNYGKNSVDILAPGVNITSTAPGAKYDTENGTSLSSPIIAGIAAVIRSYFPDLTAQEVKNILMKTATDVASKDTLLPGDDKKIVKVNSTNKTGGIINALNAFKEANKRSKYGF